MPYSQAARPRPRRIRVRKLRVAGLAVVVAAIAAGTGYQSLWASSSRGASLVVVGTAPSRSSRTPTWRGTASSRSEHRARLGEADGAVPTGTTVFDDAIPGVSKLDPALLDALRRAATAAAADGVEFVVDSGWRSPAYQERLLHEAVSKYGSEAEAARWVATPETSAHVSGDAVDIGHREAAAWLSEYGAEYGLCRIYGNEPWHYELRIDAITEGCPPMYADPTHDPRMQR